MYSYMTFNKKPSGSDTGAQKLKLQISEESAGKYSKV